MAIVDTVYLGIQNLGAFEAWTYNGSQIDTIQFSILGLQIYHRSKFEVPLVDLQTAFEVWI